jgi:hypothetical protein
MSGQGFGPVSLALAASQGFGLSLIVAAAFFGLFFHFLGLWFFVKY